MQTLHGIRFLPIARIDGTLLGLDSRWVGGPGVGLMVLLTLATLAGQLSQDTGSPLWVRLSIAFSMVPAVALTSLAHQLGPVVASRPTRPSVRAPALAPPRGLTQCGGC